MKKYKNLIYAGTFDRLHAGHEKLLDKAFELAERVAIGITADEMVKNKPLSKLIQNYELRIMSLKKYLKEKILIKRAKLFKLNDVYGPSIKNNDFDSILVTEVTKGNAEKINAIRVEGKGSWGKRKLRPLKIIVEPLLRGEDGEVISSERIRMGEINRQGNSYELLVHSYLEKNKIELILPKEMRGELRKPLGIVVGGSVSQLSETANKLLQLINLLKQKPTMVISVGDIITDSLRSVGFKPDVSIIDMRSRRKEVTVTINSNIKKQNTVINKPGTINIKTALKIKKAIKKYLDNWESQLIVVEGEEDLLALPAILFAPLNSLVLYGQFDMGVVIVSVTEEKKKGVEEILRKFI